jgi:PilZ domain
MSNQALARAASRPPQPALVERRASVRHVCNLEAVSRPLESPDALCWGARLKSISTGGLGLVLCYPFKVGALLTVDLGATTSAPVLLVKVVHVTDQSDGTWLLGCEFVQPLSETDLETVR